MRARAGARRRAGVRRFVNPVELAVLVITSPRGQSEHHRLNFATLAPRSTGPEPLHLVGRWCRGGFE
eukprot:13912578-Alexandrium_andersonii.AAC.1